MKNKHQHPNNNSFRCYSDPNWRCFKWRRFRRFWDWWWFLNGSIGGNVRLTCFPPTLFSCWHILLAKYVRHDTPSDVLLLSSHHIFPTDRYSTAYGSDNALIQHKSGCFASAVFRSNQCIDGVNPINTFAVEYNGKIYCSIVHTPTIDKPLQDAYDRNSSVESICTIKGWVHQKK